MQDWTEGGICVHDSRERTVKIFGAYCAKCALTRSGLGVVYTVLQRALKFYVKSSKWHAADPELRASELWM